ncbi:MAG: 30S ribosomal protein S6 [Erysipelotrichaceae bacterium]|jgi:small subunit ribosomal protein S6|nr:30S ribosomal protein S6 [Erysipelotrichaceae bacterium]MBR5290764.1 30S ribosomal protein S6 [Erysipelotrichaceae bacterium]
MRKYEVMYVLNASMDDAARQAEMDSIHAIITTNGGNIVKTDVWGVKEFAYEIENMTKGFYVVTTFEAENAALNEFNRLMRINKNVVRFLTIKQEA